jgi:hypothetical protein
MKYFWRITNIVLIAFAAWTGVWGTSPDRQHDTGFVRSVVALGPNTPPLWVIALVISLMSGGYTFFAMRKAAVADATFRAPSLDRSPFRQASDPLQTFGVQTAALLCCAAAATVRFFVAPNLGVGPLLFLWSWSIAIAVGGLLGYAVFRPRDVV